MDSKNVSEINKHELSNWQMTEVLNSINIGFFSRDLITDKYLSLSEGLPRIYGYDLDAFRNNSKLWYEVIIEEDRHVTEEEMRDLKNGNKSVAEYRISHPDGSIRWLEVKTLPVFEAGTMIRVEGVVYDITKRKQAELQTIREKELSENIINSLPGIFYLFDEDGHYLSWNRNFERITGYTADEIRDLSPLDFIEEEDHCAVREAMLGVFREGQGDVEARLKVKGGLSFMYYFNGQKLVIDGKNCIAGMGIDISERKAAQETLQKNERMLSHILDLIPQAIFWKDANCCFLGGNSIFANLMGVDNVKALIGKNDFDFSTTPEEAMMYQKDDQEVMRSKQPKMHYIETHAQSNGEVFWLDTTKIPLKDQNDEVYGILVVIDDITEKKIREDKQRKINEDLIRKNIELTDFSYIVSHHLRAPICKVLGLASLFDKEDPDTALNGELIEHIAGEVSSLDTVVKDLNTILANQSSAGKLVEIMSLADLIAESKKNLENELNRTQADLTYVFEVETVKTVKSYLYSIFNNLISNALKYKHPDRNPKIHIHAFDAGTGVYITFQDNGIGLDLKKVGNKIFEFYNNFQRGYGSGRGIGLKLVKTQVEAVGGGIEVDSILGEGSCFKIYLPHQ
ncbi:PAS domain-containing sensor histidine kinase [Desertivirga arenae]|uniref:PAS domain-containing sensor histidine kinase n=1 Tax=Desertivirga arenae TaxID=2810309 RepID=UPI001A964CD3|nr:PAS domain-containing sensor histidine kinase [Pedobacter sp. SYSU D00823]